MSVWDWLRSLFGRPPVSAPAPVPAVSATAVVTEINRARAQRLLPAVMNHPTLAGTAQGWALSMARAGVESHGDTFGRLTMAGYYGPAGECVAEGYPSAAAVVAAWLADGPHRAILLNPSWRYVGAGVAAAANGRQFWCVDFGG